MTAKEVKRILCGVVAATLLLGVLAGCNSGGSGKKVTLRMIESLTSPNRTTVLKEMIAKFEEENPNIKVDLISPPFDQADNKIKTMLSAKQDLDVLEVRDLTVAEFTNNNYLEPLNDYVKDWQDYETVVEVAKTVASLNDKLYFITNGMYQRQMFFRKDWFQEMDIQAPTNYEEMVAAAIKLTDPSKNRYGFSFRGGPGANGVPDTIILNQNFENIDHDDSMFLNDGKTMYSTPEAKQALELYVKLYKEGSPKDSINWGYQEQVQAFTSGVTGILLQDPDAIPALMEKMDVNTIGTAPMPKGPTGKAYTATGGGGWGIPSYSKHKEEAFKLIAFLSSPEQNTYFAQKTALIPIHTTASDDPFFQTDMYKSLLLMASKPDEFVNLKANTKYPGTGQWGQVSMETGQEMLLGKATVDDTLKKWDQFWADQRANYNK